MIKLKQGFGRLIRTRTDRGIVVILDPRVLTKPYGRTFLSSLPECPRVVEQIDLSDKRNGAEQFPRQSSCSSTGSVAAR